MAANQQSESITEIIHKKKEAKKKQKAKGLLPIVPMANSPIGLGYHTRQEAIEQGSIDPSPKRQLDAARTRNQRLNFEIDEFLYELITENMVSEKFLPFYAKACHNLGLSTMNRLKIQSYNGDNKQKLFAYKVKGALQHHFKQQFDSEA